MKQLIIAHEPNQVTIAFFLESKTPDLIAKAKEVSKLWLETEEGKKTFPYDTNLWNWGDFYDKIPRTFCQQHGLWITDITDNGCLVNFNEHLLEE